MTSRRILALPAAAALLVALAACGAPPEPATPPSPSAAPLSRSALPPRPAELQVDGVAPCMLLTDAQRAQFHLDQGMPGDAPPPDCGWIDTSVRQRAADWSVDLYPDRAADYALGSTTGVRVISIAGFPAVETVGGFADPRSSCVIAIDVAQGQSLYAGYFSDLDHQPDLTHEKACQHARDLGQALVQTLSTVKR